MLDNTGQTEQEQRTQDNTTREIGWKPQKNYSKAKKRKPIDKGEDQETQSQKNQRKAGT